MQFQFTKLFFVTSLICMICSCTEEISVEIPHEPKIIIYGEITSLKDQVTIFVQQSVPLNSKQKFKPVNDATISIYEKSNTGVQRLITSEFSVDKGKYTSFAEVFAKVGYTYWIEVKLANGTLFRSKETVMLPVVEIEDVKVEQDSLLSININITFTDPKEVKNFYKVVVDLYNEGELVQNGYETYSDIFFKGNKTLIKLVNFDPNVFGSSQILFDSLEVKLSNINYNYFKFISYLEAQKNKEDEEGSPIHLFSTPPVSLLGNIKHIDSGREKNALGNFNINSLSVKNRKRY